MKREWDLAVFFLAFASAAIVHAERSADVLGKEVRAQFENSEMKWMSGNDGRLSWRAYGDSNLVFKISNGHAGYFRLKAADLRNRTAKFPGDAEMRLKSGGSAITQIVNSDTLVCGNDQFAVICSRSGARELVSFSDVALLSDFCRFAERLYEEVIYPQVKSANRISLSHSSLMDLRIEANLLKLRVMCQLFVTGMCYGDDYERDKRVRARNVAQKKTPFRRWSSAYASNGSTGGSRSFFKSVFGVSRGSSGASKARIGSIFHKRPAMSRSEASPENSTKVIFQDCNMNQWACMCSDGFEWSPESKRVMFELGVNQLQKFRDERECPAFWLGVAISRCSKPYLRRVLENILSENIDDNDTVNIREDGCCDADVDFRRCGRVFDLWCNQDRDDSSVKNLVRMKSDILTRDSSLTTTRPFCGERQLYMQNQVRQYYCLFSDLLVVIASHKAYQAVYDTRVAQQWVKFCADGEACRYLQSNYAKNIVGQYLEAAKHKLGDEKYNAFEKTLKASGKYLNEKLPAVVVE